MDSSRDLSHSASGASLPALKPARVTLELGLMRKPFAEQLASQGLPFDADTIAHLDKDADAASRLKLRGILTYSAGNAAYDKIAKRVWAEVGRAAKALGAPAKDGTTARQTQPREAS